MLKDYEVLGINKDADEKTIKRAYFKLIRTYSPEKDPERFQEIRAAYERLMEDKNQPEDGIKLEFPADDKFAESMFDQIQQLMREQDYDRAARTAEEGMRYYHDVECFLYMYARCSILNGNCGKAVKAYEKLVKQYPDKIYYKAELAKAYNIRGYVRKAYTMFKEAYQEGWRETDFLMEYSVCCYGRGYYKESVQVLESLIDSILPSEVDNKIPELIEAYCGMFLVYMCEPFPAAKAVDDCKALLEHIGGCGGGYEELLLHLYFVVMTACAAAENSELEGLREKLEPMLPETFGDEEDAEWDEACEIMEDERFSQLMKNTVEAFMLLDDSDFPGDSFEAYADFMQMDALLCQFEEWPKQRKELELLKKEYPNIYECGSDIWAMFRESRERISFMKEMLLAEYGKKERIYQCGHYYELYPEKRQNMEQVRWDSQESGTYVRQSKKIGRNEPCPCGSGKKYKNCCGKGM